jgi:Flp pilus assembly protein TadD
MKRSRKSGTWRAPFLLALLLLAATLLLYAPVRTFSFLSFWDDYEYVTANPHVQSGLSLAAATWAFTSLEDAGYWHPLTWLSHLLDSSLFGMNPAGPHCVNLLFHAANVLLLFFLLYYATGCLGRSFFVAALFALHPLNVESVAWIAERKNVLSTFFFLLALGGYGWYVKRPNWKRYLAFTAVFVASLMSKPMVVTFPFALLLLDYWPLERLPDPTERPPRAGDSAPLSWWRPGARLALEKLPLLPLSAASSWIILVAQKRFGAMDVGLPQRLSTHLANAAHSYYEYVRMTFWPSGLAAFYPYPALPLWNVLLCALFLAAISGCVLWQRRRRYLFFGWFFFLGTLVPVIGIVQVGRQAMADRFAYIPVIGLLIMAVWLAAEAVAALRLPRAVTAVAGACLLLAAGCVARTDLWYWKDAVALWTHAHEVHPRPDRTIDSGLGMALFSAGFVDAGLQHYRVAENLVPESAILHYNIAIALMAKEEVAPAVPELQAALRYATDDEVRVNSLNYLGVAYFQLGHSEDAWRSFTAALRLDPRHATCMMGLGNILYQQGRYAEAADQFSRALAIEPTARRWLLLAESLEAAGNPAPALAAYQKALQLNPDLAEARERIAAISAQPR